MMAMAFKTPRREPRAPRVPCDRPPPPPYDPATLRAAALRYVERFATSQGRLQRFLATKLRQRGWHDATPPDLAALAAEFAERGYVDDAGFAGAKAGGMARRGLGQRRVRAQLSADGIATPLAEAAVATTAGGEAALTLARRKRLGAFGPATTDPRLRQRQMGMMLRGGHDSTLAGRLLRAATEEAAIEIAQTWDEERGAPE